MLKMFMCWLDSSGVMFIFLCYILFWIEVLKVQILCISVKIMFMLYFVMVMVFIFVVCVIEMLCVWVVVMFIVLYLVLMVQIRLSEGKVFILVVVNLIRLLVIMMWMCDWVLVGRFCRLFYVLWMVKWCVRWLVQIGFFMWNRILGFMVIFYSCVVMLLGFVLGLVKVCRLCGMVCNLIC